MASQITEKEMGTTTKADYAVDVAPVAQRESCESGCPDSTSDVAWKPGFRSQFPWGGFVAFMTVLVCAMGAVLVLLFSNHKSADQWNSKVAPNVLLSILNNISSICITLAVGQGMAIAWWRKAIKGATIKELHHSWNFGMSLKAVFMKYKYFNTVALAALMTKFAVIDGVLFQKATSTYVALSAPKNITINSYPTDIFPWTATLNLTGDTVSARIFEDPYTYDIFDWQNSPNGVFSALWGFQGCEGICETRVPSLGFAVSCTVTTSDVDYVAYSEEVSDNSTTDKVSTFDTFGVGVSLVFPTAEKNYTALELVARSYANNDLPENNDTARCPATIINHVCELRPAIIEYPMVIQLTNTSTAREGQRDSTTTVLFGNVSSTGSVVGASSENFDIETMDQIPGFKVLHYVDVQDVKEDESESSLAGILQTLNQYYGSKAWITVHSHPNEVQSSWGLNSEGLWAPVAQHTDIEVYRGYGCPWAYREVVSDMVMGLNALMFTVGDNLRHRDGWLDTTDDTLDAWMAPLAKPNVAQARKDVVYYQSNWKYMVGAIVSTIVCIICILPAYWGFWELGRKVTLGPFEIAHAFQAPVLANIHNGNGHADAVLKAAGTARVKYSEYHDESIGGRNYRFDAHS